MYNVYYDVHKHIYDSSSIKRALVKLLYPELVSRHCPFTKRERV